MSIRNIYKKGDDHNINCTMNECEILNYINTPRLYVNDLPGNNGDLLQTNASGEIEWVPVSSLDTNIYTSDGFIPNATIRTVTIDDTSRLRIEGGSLGAVLSVDPSTPRCELLSSGELLLGGSNFTSNPTSTTIISANVESTSTNNTEIQAGGELILTSTNGGTANINLGATAQVITFNATGGLRYPTAPSIGNDLCNKTYVDTQVTGVGNTLYSGNGSITGARTVQFDTSLALNGTVNNNTLTIDDSANTIQVNVNGSTYLNLTSTQNRSQFASESITQSNNSTTIVAGDTFNISSSSLSLQCDSTNVNMRAPSGEMNLTGNSGALLGKSISQYITVNTVGNFESNNIETISLDSADGCSMSMTDTFDIDSDTEVNLTVSGGAYINMSSNIVHSGTFQNTVTTASAFIDSNLSGGGTTGGSIDNNGQLIRTPSDIALKENIADLPLATSVSLINDLTIKTYTWKAPHQATLGTGTYVGLVIDPTFESNHGDLCITDGYKLFNQANFNTYAILNESGHIQNPQDSDQWYDSYKVLKKDCLVYHLINYVKNLEERITALEP